MANENLLMALELDKKGEWEAAHKAAQMEESEDGYWLHAYLHRKAGDHNNASYWYSRAGQSVPTDSLEEEWKRLQATFSRK